jgi:hypothetical protein
MYLESDLNTHHEGHFAFTNWATFVSYGMPENIHIHKVSQGEYFQKL